MEGEENISMCKKRAQREVDNGERAPYSKKSTLKAALVARGRRGFI